MELVVMISGGFRSTFESVLPGFIQATGTTARVLHSPPWAARLTRSRTGWRVARPATCWFGVAVRAGAPVPDVGTPDALRAALLAAGSVAYSDSASGAYIEGALFTKLGIVGPMKDKARQVAEAPVGEVVAAGKAELGFQEVAELLPVKGIRFVGKLPSSLEVLTPYAAAVATCSTHPETALELVRFIARPDLGPVLERMGLEPPQR